MNSNFSLLIGKKIVAVQQMKKQQLEDNGWLRLDFEDGSFCVIVAGYGSYSGNAEDEYPTRIGVIANDTGLIPYQEEF